MISFFSAKNLSSKELVESRPWEFIVSDKNNWPKKLEKTRRRRELLRPDADWDIYTAVRGFAPNLIISKDNSPAGLRGFVGDYDMEADLDTVCKYIDQIPRSIHPSFIEVTHSDKLRLVWPFEREILIPSTEFCIALLSAFADKLHAKTLLAGFDEASLKPAERWTNGGRWHEIEGALPLSWKYCFGVVCEVSKKANLFNKGQIPLEEIAEEVQNRFPGRWQGDFRLDAIGVRFWVETADNPTGCQVKPDGMLCFTGKEPFVKWEQIFGKPWCEEKRIINLGKAGENIIFDGRNYWEFLNGRWVTSLRIDIVNRLCGRGLSDIRAKGETQSDVSRVVDYIQQVNRVEGAAPFINYRPGLLEIGGLRFLNTAHLKVVQPLAGPTGDPAVDFPFVSTLLLGLFAREEQNPLDYWLTWLKFGHLSYLNYTRHVGQAIFLCGPVNNGKTLVCNHIVGPMLGTPPNSGADPMKYLTGTTAFNKELFQWPLLAINDQDSPRTDADKQKMIQNLKALVVNPNHPYQPKFCDVVTVQWTGRVFVTLNDDASSVGVLPEVNKNTQDKLMFFASQPYRGIWPSQAVIESTIAAELPYFSHWLINVYEPPAEVLSTDYRGGVRSYFDPVILNLSRQQLYAYNFEELLKAWVKYAAYWADENNGEWRGTPTDLLTDMASYDPLKSITKEWTQSRAARAMTTLAKQEDGPVQFVSEGSREFIIYKNRL